MTRERGEAGGMKLERCTWGGVGLGFSQQESGVFLFTVLPSNIIKKHLKQKGCLRKLKTGNSILYINRAGVRRVPHHAT